MPLITSALTLITSLTTVALAAANFEGSNLSPGTQVGDWKYVGCANEIPGRALTGSSFSDDSMTIERCQDYCKTNTYPLSGVEYGRECYCGKTVADPAKFGQTDCNMNCKGNNNEMCGGNARVSIFNNTNFVGPAPPKTIGSWQYQSCYMEPMNARALDTLIKADDKMTIDMCTQACQGAQYAYAGLEYGRECWCGAAPYPDLEDASDPGCAMQCDMVCGGNGMQICGGRGAITIYKNGATKRSLSEGLDIDTIRARKGRFLKARKIHIGDAARAAH
ncbi:WSC-domain-containing protein [Xylariaceae sp. FL1651]|nr:WSC-domain-containing protein [Xylariaceae sp. FL1651]